MENDLKNLSADSMRKLKQTFNELFADEIKEKIDDGFKKLVEEEKNVKNAFQAELANNEKRLDNIEIMQKTMHQHMVSNATLEQRLKDLEKDITATQSHELHQELESIKKDIKQQSYILYGIATAVIINILIQFIR